jgi:thymidylate synthase
MYQYLELLETIIGDGVEKESGRANMPNTIGISKGEIYMDLQNGFPLLTTKKMYWKGIVHELLWFLRGETNIKYLVDNNVNIWNGDAYRWYLKYCNDNEIEVYFDTQDKFVDFIKSIKSMYYDSMNTLHYELETTDDKLYAHLLQLNARRYIMGDLGKVYGYQWRNQNGVDQIKDVVEGLKSNPYSRYHIIDGWNKADFKDMALPPCHLLYQFIVRPLTLDERMNLYEKSNNDLPDFNTIEEYVGLFDSANIPKFYLDLNMYQRSCDTFLGVPFNIASMSILLMIMAKVSNMAYGVARWIGGDTHLYMDHIPMVKEQLSREPRELPILKINKELNCLEDILALTIDDFELVGYDNPHPAIKAELFTGLKK